MTGISRQGQKAMLDDVTSGFERTLYLALLTGSAAGSEPNEDGTLPAGMDEVNGGVAGIGYTRKTIAGNATPGNGDWSAAAVGPPTTKQLPKSGGAAIAWTAAGGNFGQITAWALLSTPINTTWAAADVVASGPIVDGSGTPIAVTINDGSSFEFNDANPIIVRMGDPAKVVDATAGTQRTVPI